MTGKRQPGRGLATTSKNPALGVVGHELPPETPIKALFSKPGAPKGAPFSQYSEQDADLQRLIAAWPGLNPDFRRMIAGLAKTASEAAVGAESKTPGRPCLAGGRGDGL